MLFRLLTLLFLCAAIISCNKPDPNPELKDPIYNDLNSRLGSTKQALEAEKKALEGFEQALKEVVPQTGQIKYAQKRVYESQAKIMRLGQELKYLEYKIVSRKKDAKKSYSEAFKKGATWPNPAEFEAYQGAQRLRAAKSSWDTQARVQSLSAGAKKAPAGHGEEGEKKSEGGGH